MKRLCFVYYKSIFASCQAVLGYIFFNLYNQNRKTVIKPVNHLKL